MSVHFYQNVVLYPKYISNYGVWSKCAGLSEIHVAMVFVHVHYKLKCDEFSRNMCNCVCLCMWKYGTLLEMSVITVFWGFVHFYQNVVLYSKYNYF